MKNCSQSRSSNFSSSFFVFLLKSKWISIPSALKTPQRSSRTCVWFSLTSSLVVSQGCSLRAFSEAHWSLLVVTSCSGSGSQLEESQMNRSSNENAVVCKVSKICQRQVRKCSKRDILLEWYFDIQQFLNSAG